MKLLVSNSTKTLVPTKASARGSRPGLRGAPLSPAINGRVVPSSLTCRAGRFPSANVAIFCTIPSSVILKSLGFSPLRYSPLLLVTVKLRTTISTLTRNTGRSCAQSSNVAAPTATEDTIATRFDRNFMAFPPDNLDNLLRFILRRKLGPGLGPDLGANDPQGLQQRRPVFQMRGENPLHHPLRPLRNQHIGEGARCTSSARTAQYNVFDS